MLLMKLTSLGVRSCADEGVRASRSGRVAGLGVSLAHELYETLFGPIELLIKDKWHLIVVPSGEVASHLPRTRCGRQQ
jgi:hypothetical protein